jgi:alkanesulfonate monooxygenase SsuD/methylene tetrahydromethanopterin reductase-like flavin-dependent oxidoreductase (luciferase family)
MSDTMRAKFGLSLSNRAVLFGWASIDDLLEAAAMAERSGGFHGVWVGDNLLSKPRLEAIVTLAAIAARTQRVKLGTICLASFPLRDPILLAIQWASLDLLSGGRTILAVCNGGSARDGPQFAHELAVMGVKSHERVGRLLEGIAILRRLWTEERVSHHGKYYRFEEVELLPKPVQRPVPIYIAVNPREGRVDAARLERILQRVAAHADGWQTDATPVDTFRARFAAIREHAARQGRDPARLESCLHLMVHIDDDRRRALREAEAFLHAYYGAGAVSRERADLWLAYGPPAAVIDKIQAYVDAGCTMPVLRFVARDLKGQLQRCIEEVLPAFRGG